MGSNVCQLRINCLPAPNAPFHKCMLCDHRWDSFKHFSFTMSRMLSLPDTEHWRDPEENVYPTISSPGRYSVGLCPIHMWRPDHVVPHQPYRPTFFLRPTPRETHNSAEKELPLYAWVPPAWTSSSPITGLGVGGPSPPTFNHSFDCWCSTCSPCHQVIKGHGPPPEAWPNP